MCFRFLGTIRESCQASTVAGLHYVFEPGQTKAARLAWSILVLGLAIGFLYVSMQNYQDWQNQVGDY